MNWTDWLKISVLSAIALSYQLGGSEYFVNGSHETKRKRFRQGVATGLYDRSGSLQIYSTLQPRNDTCIDYPTYKFAYLRCFYQTFIASGKSC